MKVTKRIALLLVITVLVFTMLSCKMSHEKVLDTLPNYFASFEYLDPNGFRDYTYYCKYYYKDITAETFNDNRFFTLTSHEDVEYILSFIDDYEDETEHYGEVQKIYDFDKSIISEGDYFYVYTMEGTISGGVTYEKFDHYDVYYFDLDAQILYYFHTD